MTGKGLHLLKIRDDVKSSFNSKIKERRKEIVIYRLRLGHVGVNQYFHRFNMSNTENCNYCQASETIEHLLLACRKYQEQKRSLKERLKKYKVMDINMKILLGGDDTYGKLNRAIANATAEYINDIGRLNDL